MSTFEFDGTASYSADEGEEAEVKRRFDYSRRAH